MIDLDSQLRMLSAHDANEQLHIDWSTTENIYAWCYLLESEYANSLLKLRPDNAATFLILDHRQAKAAEALMSKHHGLVCYTWSTNRTMHDKTLAIPTLGTVWLTTANLTRGSWTYAANSYLRITSPSFAHRMLQRWHEQKERCKRVVAKTS